jgi:riboflavin kinase/FMN adenylyltransferase
MELIAQCGIHITLCADFTRLFADQHPREFAKNVLVDTLGAKEVIVGFDYAFGRGREGTILYLQKMGEELGFTVHIVDPVKIDGQIVSSSRVRELVEGGDVEKAAAYLGRPYSLSGPVVKGFKTGAKIGFPTANIDTKHVQVPGAGVYAVYFVREHRLFPAVANVGFNPTFHRDKLALEVHILNFEGDLYGREIEVVFIKRLRDEIEFRSAAELAKQIAKDIEAAKTLLEEKAS